MFTMSLLTVSIGSQLAELIQAVMCRQGRTALHLAAGGGCTRLVDLLIEVQADQSIRDSNGRGLRRLSWPFCEAKK